jgi:DNA-binding Lrp family transcriptional regulator
VQLARHGAEEGRRFATLLSTRAEVVSAWTMTGEADYLLRIYCPDLSALNRLIQEVLLAHPDVARVHSQIVMDQPKGDAPLPVF